MWRLPFSRGFTNTIATRSLLAFPNKNLLFVEEHNERHVPVVGGPKIGKKGQSVHQSSGFLLKFCRRFQYIFYALTTIGKHVQTCATLLFYTIDGNWTPRKSNASNALTIVWGAGITRRIGFSCGSILSIV